MGPSPQVRIFFSSPGDVKMERETARRIVDRLQGEVGGRMVIEPYFWEHEVMVATKDYQENIPQMDGFDIVVCVLWSRLGTPLHPNRHPRPDGGFFESGTEYEFFTAMQAHQLRGTPDIFVFRNSTEPRRPSRPKEAREAVDREVDRLDNFFERYFQEEKYFTAAVNIYSTLGEFEDKLTLALRSFIEGRFPKSGGKSARKPQYAGLPYLGLSAFDFKDSPVFFGRTAQIGNVVESFQVQELEAQTNGGSGKRFVLILGSSGSGKSSLARAGVLPMLVQPGVIEGAQAWRRVIFTPDDAGGDPFAAFAAALMSPEALPEIASAGTTSAEIAVLIKSDSGGAEILLRQALGQAGALARTEEEQRLTKSAQHFEAENREEDARVLREKIANLEAPVVRLAVLVDQLEELFTAGISDDTISAFIDRLSSLATSSRVFVLGTLRSDFYPRCLEHPKLVELMRESGTYALPAPSPADLGQMIRQPAAAAGLVFEENKSTGENLDELLRDAAIKDPSALPLLSYTLEQLYERRTADGLLTLAAFHELGGLEGAIGCRAEAVFAGLPADAQAAFDPLWRQLVTLSENSQPVRRRTFYSTLRQDPASLKLVDALVAARLLTADQAPGGERTVSVAHEALLRHWPRVVGWVGENMDFLRARSRLGARLAEWLDHASSDDYLIPSGPALAEGEGILAKHQTSLDPREIDYITRSAARARKREQARLNTARMVAAGALLLSLLAIAGGVVAWSQKKAADREKVAAIRQKSAAEEAAKAALASQTRAAYLLGIENLEAGKSRDGLTNLAQALTLDPGHAGARDRLYSYHLYGLPKAIPIRSVAGPKHSRQRITGANLGPDQRVVYLTDTKAVEVFDLNTRKVVPGPWENEPDSFASVISHTSTHVLNVRRDISSRIWSVATGQMSAVLQTDKDFTQISVTKDGDFFLDSRPDGVCRVRRASDGKFLADWRQEGPITALADTQTGNFVSISESELVAFDRTQMKVIARRKDPEWYFNQVKVAPEAEIGVVFRLPRPETNGVAHFQFIDTRTLEAIPDSRIAEVPNTYMWDAQVNRLGTAVAFATSNHAAEIRHRHDAKEDRIFKFATYPTKVCFSPDERLFITSTPDGTVRIFDADSTKPAFEPISHDGRLEDLSISWDGRYLLTATAERARIWDLSVGPALSLPLVQADGISAMVFANEENRIWLADSPGLQQWDLRDLKPVGDPLHKDSRVHDWLIDRTGTQTALLWNSKNIRFARTDDPDTEKAPTWEGPAKVDYWNLSEDGKRASATIGTAIHLIDTRTAKTIGTPWKFSAAPLDTSFVNGSSRIFAILPSPVNAWSQNEVKLRDIETSTEIPIAQAEASVSMIRISPGGRWLAASATGVGQAYRTFAVLWDLESPSTPPRSIPHPDGIFNIGFNADGTLLAISGNDQTVQVWHTATASKAANPIYDPFGVVQNFAFSPDSRLLGTVSTEGSNSAVRAWDWKEGSAVSESFPFPTIAERLRFTPDGRKLLFIRPSDAGSEKRLLQLVEISPPADLEIDLVALTEGATALLISKNELPVACDPFGSWERLRAAAPDSWFFQPPASRAVSPAFNASSLRWIEEEAVPIDTMRAAMPSVGLARASASYWDQARYNRRMDALEGKDPKSQEYLDEVADLAKLAARITMLVDFAERSAPNDAPVCLYLSRQAKEAGNVERAVKFIERALSLAPEEVKIQSQAASIYRDTGNDAAELKALERLRVLEPDVVNHRLFLGYNHQRSGRKDAALAEFTAIVDHPRISKVDRAPMLVALGRGKEALGVYKELAEMSKAASEDKVYPLDALMHMILGHFHAGENDAAIDWYRQLIAAAKGAAKAEVIDSTTLAVETKEALKKVLILTLVKHPELAPKPAAN